MDEGRGSSTRPKWMKTNGLWYVFHQNCCYSTARADLYGGITCHVHTFPQSLIAAQHADDNDNCYSQYSDSTCCSVGHQTAVEQRREKSGFVGRGYKENDLCTANCLIAC